MSWAALALLLAAAEVEPSPQVLDARHATRLRWGVAGVGAGGVGIGHGGFGFGAGVSAEVGGVFADRWSLVPRLTVATVLVANLVSFAAAVEYSLSDTLGVSLGLGGSYLGATGFDLPVSVSLIAPLRVLFSPHARAGVMTARKGLQLFFEAQLGWDFAGSYGYVSSGFVSTRPPLSVSGVLGVGFGMW